MSCARVVNDSRGDGINCEMMKERCNVLLKAPFTNCSVDPQPFITACTNLLCNYTDTDGLFCHLLDAYARSCGLEDWGEEFGCSDTGCFEKQCLYDNEFCGLSLGGDARCFCRSSYAAPYRANGTLGDDTVCVSKSASVSLVGCLLEEKGIDIPSLRLNDPNCTGVQDLATNKVTFTFSDTDHCAANVSINGSRIIYANTIMTPGDTGDIINREDQLSIHFSCTYAQPQVQTMSLKILDSSVVKVIDAGEWAYVLKMTAYTDVNLLSALDSGTQLHLNDYLWIQAKATEVDKQLMALVIEDCWATKEAQANATQRYNLISNGCSDEETVTVVSNGEGLASVFSLRVFQFVGSTTDVYLHCDTKLCLKSTNCTKTALDGVGRRWTALDGVGRRGTALDGVGRRWTAWDGVGRRWTAWDGVGLVETPVNSMSL
ncbi:alpha-tectorin-like [Periophthalmus magnuspinnatus]|uniref:alpha-tectorin-like n=1 Tax=Periophthalmus magnuspinnatus TaxID=409849 RepID=UPI002436C3B9|nr:alpha-tectorin-like [Periophthalmus magnuspinnatus]